MIQGMILFLLFPPRKSATFRLHSFLYVSIRRGGVKQAPIFRGLFYCGYLRFLPLAAIRWAAVTVRLGVLRTLLAPLPLPFSSRPHAVPSSNFMKADQSKPSFDILLKSGISGRGSVWILVLSLRRGAADSSPAAGAVCAGAAGFSLRTDFFGAGAYSSPPASAVFARRGLRAAASSPSRAISAIGRRPRFRRLSLRTIS